METSAKQAAQRLDLFRWARSAGGYAQGNARLARLKERTRITGWSLYIDDEYRGNWRTLRQAKRRALEIAAGSSRPAEALANNSFSRRVSSGMTHDHVVATTQQELTGGTVTDEGILEYIADLDTDLAIAHAAMKILRGPHRASCREAVAEAISARRSAANRIALPPDLVHTIEVYLSQHGDPGHPRTTEAPTLAALNSVAYIGERILALYVGARGARLGR